MLGDPNVVYLLFLLGLLAITAEVYHPGALVPGVVGAVALVLALVAFTTLPVSVGGILLVLAALALFIGELHTGTGGLAVAALVALLVGSLIFYGSSLHVSPPLIVLTSLAFAGFFLLALRASVRTRRLAVKTGIPALLGQTGIATSELAPLGTVRIDGEAWSAESVNGPVHSGDSITVVGATGVTLHVMHAALDALEYERSTSDALEYERSTSDALDHERSTSDALDHERLAE